MRTNQSAEHIRPHQHEHSERYEIRQCAHLLFDFISLRTSAARTRAVRRSAKARAVPFARMCVGPAVPTVAIFTCASREMHSVVEKSSKCTATRNAARTIAIAVTSASPPPRVPTLCAIWQAMDLTPIRLHHCSTTVPAVEREMFVYVAACMCDAGPHTVFHDGFNPSEVALISWCAQRPGIHSENMDLETRSYVFNAQNRIQQLVAARAAAGDPCPCPCCTDKRTVSIVTEVQCQQ